MAKNLNSKILDSGALFLHIEACLDMAQWDPIGISPFGEKRNWAAPTFFYTAVSPLRQAPPRGNFSRGGKGGHVPLSASQAVVVRYF